jgi:hypothetical protein
MFQADLSVRLVLNFGLELFTESADLTLPPGISNFETNLKFWDDQVSILQVSFLAEMFLGKFLSYVNFGPISIKHYKQVLTAFDGIKSC